MNQLAIHEPQSVIIFFDGIKKFLPTKKAEMLYDDSAKNSGFTLDGGYYKFSSISKIIPAEDYYKQNPDERPVETEYFKSEEQPINERIEEYTGNKRVLVFKRLISGITKFITEFDGDAVNAKKMRADWDLKMEEATRESV